MRYSNKGNRKPANQAGQLCLAASDKLVIPPLSEVNVLAVVQGGGNLLVIS